MNVGSETQRQWFTRPDDEKFEELEDLYMHVASRKAKTKTTEVKLGGLEFVPLDENGLALNIKNSVRGRTGLFMPTNWAFSQACAMVGAHASYLEELPAKLAAECLNFGIHKRVGERNRDLELMLVGDDDAQIHAITSNGYGRAWDAHSVRFAMEIQDLTNGRFQSPHDWGGVKRALFAGDRDLHMLFVDGGSLVDGGGERDRLNRGFLLGNSEVGSKAWYFATFLFRIVCGNFGIHGLEQVSFFSIKHTLNAPMKIAQEAMPHIRKYMDASPKHLEGVVRKAKETKLPADVKDFMTYFRNRRFTGPEIANAIVLADKEEGKHDVLWDMYNGFTATARNYKNADVAANLQSRAGKLLEMVA